MSKRAKVEDNVGGGVDATMELDRILKLLPHLPAARLLKLTTSLVNDVPAAAARAAQLMPVLTPDMKLCAVCKITFDSNNNFGPVCKSQEHEMDDDGYRWLKAKGCGRCDLDEKAPCRWCSANMCYSHATAKLPAGATVDYCYQGPHITTWKFAKK